jgi:hypothetical protein
MWLTQKKLLGVSHVEEEEAKGLFPELEEIVSVLRSNRRQDILILIIPSADKRDIELKNQEIWANSALELFAELYGGATAFKTFAGIYKSDDGKILHDQPILIESYVQRETLEDEATLKQLLDFCKRMGRETNQAAVGLIVNSVFREITDY